MDLYRGGEVEKLYVHNVILRTFEGRRPGDPEEVHGHHIDGDRFNNATSNLEWKEVEEHHQEHNERDEWEPEPAPF